MPHLSPDFVEPALAEDDLRRDDSRGKHAELGDLCHAEIAATCPAARVLYLPTRRYITIAKTKSVDLRRVHYMDVKRGEKNGEHLVQVPPSV